MLLQSHTGKKISTSTSLAFVRFFISLALAASNTVWAIYLYHFQLSDSAIGFLSAFFLIVSLVTALLIIPVLEKYKLKSLILISLLVSTVGYISIAVITNLYFFLLINLILSINAAVRIAAIDINFRDNTEDEHLNKQMGFLYTILNIAWLIGPLIAGVFLLEFGITFVFLSVAIFYLLSIALFLFIRCPHQKKERDGLDKHVILNIIQYLKDKKLMNAYIISLGLQVWWGLVYIYMPLFIISHGLSEGFVSVFFALIIIPLILIEYRVSRLSEKYGFRHFFRYGFLLLAIMGFVLFLVENIYIQIGIVIVASFFAGFIEPLFESYFFTIVKKVDEEKYYPLFSTAIDVGGILGKAFPAIGLLFLPEKYAFVIIGILMLCFYIYVKRIKEVVPPFRHIPSILDYTKLPHRR